MTKEEIIKEIAVRKEEMSRSKPRHKCDIYRYIRRLERQLYKCKQKEKENGQI